MIHGIHANQSSFHSVEFTSGLNVILAERTDTSTQKDTRNGLGKTTLIEIIDFCLGSSGKSLRIDPLKEWAFTIDITLAGNRIKATRSVKSHNRIVVDGLTDGWIEQPDEDRESGELVFNLKRWRTLLGWALFGLPRTDDAHKYKPTYRSLISYFIRDGLDAYADPFRHYRQQKTWDIQLNIGFLLALNWEYASRWQELKDQEKALKALDQAIKTGAIADTIGTVGELEAERIRLEEQIEHEREALSSFKVHPQYEAVQKEADKQTATIHELTNQNVCDRRKLARYEESVTSEKPPTDVSLERLYEETGIVFTDTVRRTLDEARAFHKKIVENRKSFLGAEVSRLKRQVEQRDTDVRKLTDDRSNSLSILSTHGALQEMTKLQERFLDTKERLERVRTRISESKDLVIRKRAIKITKTELETTAEQDHEQRRELWTNAVRLFNDHSQALYERPGRLVIDISETGYKYDVEIERSGSEGVGKMKIFCFDLMLSEFIRREDRRIDFLIHDSTLYDAVDSRQRALALERALEVCNKLGTQYICALNSDMVPWEDFSKNFDFNSRIRLTLTDRDRAGALLGIQFERPSS
jgi:uncharacterized protein YydD (DUF2326 family)